MNAAHLHLVLNHVPIVGLGFALLALFWGVARHSAELRKFSLVVLVLVAVAATAAYLTGEPAEDLVKKLPGIAGQAIESHEESAAVAFGAVVGLGLFALIGLIVFHGKKIVPQWFGASALVLTFAIAGLMTWTAKLGGEIHHTEIHSVSAHAVDDEDHD